VEAPRSPRPVPALERSHLPDDPARRAHGGVRGPRRGRAAPSSSARHERDHGGRRLPDPQVRPRRQCGARGLPARLRGRGGLPDLPARHGGRRRTDRSLDNHAAGNPASPPARRADATPDRKSRLPTPRSASVRPSAQPDTSPGRGDRGGVPSRVLLLPPSDRTQGARAETLGQPLHGLRASSAGRRRHAREGARHLAKLTTFSVGRPHRPAIPTSLLHRGTGARPTGKFPNGVVTGGP